MSEAGFNLIMNIMSGIQVFLYAACMTAFFYPFMAGKKEQRKSRIKKVLMVFAVYMVMYFIGMTTSVYGWLCMIIVIVLLAAASKFLDMEREFTILLGVLFFCARKLSALIMRSVSFIIDKRLEQKAETLEVTKNIFSRAASNYAFVAVLQMLLLSVMLCVMGRLLKKKSESCI